MLLTLERVSKREWVQRVRRGMEAANEAGEEELQLHLLKNPGEKLLEVFETTMTQMTAANVLDVQNTAKVSEKL
ncbi:acetyl-CoA synthetase-like protein [Penicillium malachiteum]|nr:acetyl-CoA synthetase-like protein [Penicillium malachiteum]